MADDIARQLGIIQLEVKPDGGKIVGGVLHPEYDSSAPARHKGCPDLAETRCRFHRF